MSFFDDASLAFLPSGGAGKDTKAYSIKPTDGSGDFTFSRGSNLAATRVGPTGLIEKGRENLLAYSNDFEEADWLQVNTTRTSGQSGYDGSSNAWKIEATSTGTIRLRQLKNISANSVITMSLYAKIGNVDFIKFNLLTSGTNSIATFDLTDGTTYSSNAIDEKWESVGNGWVRISATFTNSLQITEQRIEVRSEYDLLSAPAGSFVYIQDAQVESGLAATDYIESGATTGKAGLLENEPRFDYSGGATCPSLLLEPSRTQLITQSEYFGAWNTNGTASVTDNQSVSPEGVSNAALLDFGSTTLGANRIDLEPAISAGANYVFSVFVKNIDANRIGIRNYNTTKDAIANFDFSSGSFTDTNVNVIDTIVEPFSNGWYRIGIVFNSGVDTTADVRISPDTTSGSDGQQIYVYGASLEQGSYPTSYIPNHSGGSVTRGGDNCSTSNNSLLEQTSATYFLELTPIEILSNNLIEVRGDGSTSNRIIFQTTNSGGIRVLVRAQGSSILDQNVDSAVSQNTKVKVALKYTPSNISFFVDGVKKIDTDVSVDFNPELNGLDLEGSATANDDALKQHQFLFFPEALSDADCITLTT